MIEIEEFTTSNELARLLNVPIIDIFDWGKSVGIYFSENQRLDAEIIYLVSEHFNIETKIYCADQFTNERYEFNYDEYWKNIFRSDTFVQNIRFKD